ncbi:MAG: hypothetical protein MPJ50_05120 [Pirellulales bacterium]|nr:hypothetical protein [Pirellulales bacterium]
MNWIAIAFETTWFYVLAIVVAAIYGLGGLVHVANMVGLGEVKWRDAPLAWKVGDVMWGILDIAAVILVILRAHMGLLAILIAAVSQIVIYGFFPTLFALNETQRKALRGMVIFHVVVIAILGTSLYLAVTPDGPHSQ